MITPEKLLAVMPKLGAEKSEAFAPLVSQAMLEFEITTPLREAAFVSQLAHESRELTRLVENLNYSAKRLMAVWPSRFPSFAVAQKYAYKPEQLANFVYSNRLGNGPAVSGDGWRYRGRGPMMITGRDMYERAGQALGLNLVARPELLEQMEIGLRAAGWFWRDEKRLNPLADRGEFREITRRINGGYTNLAERQQYYARAKQVLGIAA
jgi:putative chitinase